MPIQSIMENLYLLPIPVPLPVKDTNCYAFDTAQGWVILDTGMDTDIARQTWESYASELQLDARGIHTVVITHFHPDHLGLAHWFHERFHAPIAMSRGDSDTAREYLHPREPEAASLIDQTFYLRHGVPSDRWQTWHAMEQDFRRSVELPPLFHHIEHGETLRLEPFALEFIEQGGHTDHQLLVHDSVRQLLFTGDQILKRISPNISLWPTGDRNPLASYLTSLQYLLTLSPLGRGLPAHESLIDNVAGRILEIITHHKNRNQTILALLKESGPQSAFELTPRLFTRPMDDYQWRFALGETLAHLEYLRSEGGIALDDASTVYRYSPSQIDA